MRFSSTIIFLLFSALRKCVRLLGDDVCTNMLSNNNATIFVCTSISNTCVYVEGRRLVIRLSKRVRNFVRQFLLRLVSFFFVRLLNLVLLFNSFVLGILKLRTTTASSTLHHWDSAQRACRCRLLASSLSLPHFFLFVARFYSQLIHLDDSSRTFYFESITEWVEYPISISSHFLSSSSYI